MAIGSSVPASVAIYCNSTLWCSYSHDAIDVLYMHVFYDSHATCEPKNCDAFGAMGAMPRRFIVVNTCWPQRTEPITNRYLSHKYDHRFITDFRKIRKYRVWSMRPHMGHV